MSGFGRYFKFCRYVNYTFRFSIDLPHLSIMAGDGRVFNAAFIGENIILQVNGVRSKSVLSGRESRERQRG